MLTRATLSGEHSELTVIASALATALDDPTPDMARLGSLRWRMSRVMMQHLAKEDAHLYPRLVASPDTVVRDVARRFQREMGTLATTYRAYLVRWPASAIVADWDGYRRDTRAILTALAERIRREETELYAHVA